MVSVKNLPSVSTALEVVRLLMEGGDLIEDAKLGAWLLHAKGAGSVDGVIFRVPARIVEALKTSKRIAVADRPAPSGRQWVLFEEASRQ